MAQISMTLYIWSNGLNNSTGNQHCLKSLFYNYLQIKIMFTWFLMREENQSTGRKTSQSRVENPHMMLSAEIEPGPHFGGRQVLSPQG